MQFMTLSFFHEGCHITAIQVQVHHPYISFFPREWTYTSHFRLQGQPQFYTISSSPFTMFSGSCLTVLLISDHSPILLYTTDNFSYRHFTFKFLTLTILDNCTVFQITDNTNHWQLYFQLLTFLATSGCLYFISLTNILLTTDTDNCISYH